MAKQYTHFSNIGGGFLHKYVDENGNRKSDIIRSTPLSLYIETNNENSDSIGFHNEPLKRCEFKNTYDARNFIKEMSFKKVHGNQNYIAQVMRNEYPEGIQDPNNKFINVVCIDIETMDGQGFPKPEEATQEVTAITISLNKETYWTFSTKEYTSKSKNKIYVYCNDEHDLFDKFLTQWQEIDPDIVTGWNCKFFDMPYLYNRLVRLYGIDSDMPYALSPMGLKYSKRHAIKEEYGFRLAYKFLGFDILDYLDLFKSFTFTKLESYKLGHVLTHVLGEGKIDIAEYDSFSDLFNNDFELFIDYNIRDVSGINEMDDKLGFIDMALILAYMANAPFGSIYSKIAIWDSFLYNLFENMSIVMPPNEFDEKNGKYEGAVVFDPQVGLHKWVVSFDLDSLYPHLIMMYGISPESKVTDLSKFKENNPEEYEVMSKYWNNTRHKFDLDFEYFNGTDKYNIIDMCKKIGNLHITPNGALFDTSIKPIMPKVMEDLYIKRSAIKKRGLELQQEAETKHGEEHDDLMYKAYKMHGKQLVLKVFLNSFYGYLGTTNSRFYDVDIAEAITKSGQLAIIWIKEKLNAKMNRIVMPKEFTEEVDRRGL